MIQHNILYSWPRNLTESDSCAYESDDLSERISDSWVKCAEAWSVIALFIVVVQFIDVFMAILYPFTSFPATCGESTWEAPAPPRIKSV
jgi:hypothetical protein